MFEAPDVGAAADFLEQAHRLAPDDDHVEVAVEVASADGSPDVAAVNRKPAMIVVEHARRMNDSQLLSAALDAATNERIQAGDVVTAHRLAAERVERLSALPKSPRGP